MHVTGGLYKGHKIIIPTCAKPTLSKTREGVFNILYSIFQDFNDMFFLDLFSGSGIMSLEALSRGFKTISVDKSKDAVRLIKKNLEIAKEGYEVYLKDSYIFVQNADIKPDVIYIDPPWDIDYKKIIKLCIEKYRNVIIIIEYDKKNAQDFAQFYAQNLAPFKEKVYGRCKLDFIKT